MAEFREQSETPTFFKLTFSDSKILPILHQYFGMRIAYLTVSFT